MTVVFIRATGSLSAARSSTRKRALKLPSGHRVVQACACAGFPTRLAPASLRAARSQLRLRARVVPFGDASEGEGLICMAPRGQKVHVARKCGCAPRLRQLPPGRLGQPG